MASWSSGWNALCVASCALAMILILAVASAPMALGAECPNEAVRQQQGEAALALGECRAYELVSPRGPMTVDALESQLGFQLGKVAPDGNAAAYGTRYPAESASVSSRHWLARRSSSGWDLQPVDPPMTPVLSNFGPCEQGVAFSENLDSFLLSAGLDLEGLGNVGGECGYPVEELVPGEPRGYANLYLSRLGGPFVLTNPLASPANAHFQAASRDLSRVIFTSAAALDGESPDGYKLYVWADGVVRPVGILPETGEHVPVLMAAGSGRLTKGGGPGQGRAMIHHSVSVDGERIIFEYDGNLYLRENAGQPSGASANCATSEPGKACTLQLDKSVGAGDDGGGVFLFASRDGSRVFFLSDHALTFPASALPNRPDLYEYDVPGRKLNNLTAGGGEPANVRGFSGGSTDGSHIYFVARGVLTGTQQNEHGESAQPGEPNLYLAYEGGLTYIATLVNEPPGHENPEWWATTTAAGEVVNDRLDNAWSPSGRYLAFSSYKALTGADNVPAEPGPRVCDNRPTCRELFLYDAQDQSLRCVSCPSEGGKPVGNTIAGQQRSEMSRLGLGPLYAPRVVSDDGRVVFQTEAALVPGDVNGAMDVYEYRGGDRRLISSGRAKGGSGVFDASADGSGIFFITPESLVGADRDGRPSLYVARVNGGFLEPPPPADPCSTEQSCRPGPGPQPLPGTSPVTATFSDPGNARPRFCKRNQVRRKGRCVNRKKRHDHKRRTKAPKRCGAKAKRGKQRGACTRGKARTNAPARPARKGGR